MNKSDVIRAWKDEAYRDSLTAEQRALIPDHPAGIVDLGDDALRLVTGGLIEIDPDPNPKPQTGTNAAEACWCEKSRTANSDGGSCWCTC